MKKLNDFSAAVRVSEAAEKDENDERFKRLHCVHFPRGEVKKLKGSGFNGRRTKAGRK